MSWPRRPAISCCAALLAGCTVGPNFHRPSIATPAGFAEPHRGAATDSDFASWWQAFGDPELDRLVALALAHNLDVEMASAKIQEARASEIVAGAASAPQVAAAGSVSRQRISENAIPIPPGAGGQSGSGSAAGFGLPGSEFTTWRAGFDASWELDLFGKTRRSVEAARARSGAALWNRRDAELSAAAEVASDYVSLRALQQRIAIASAEVGRQERSEQLVAARAHGGLVTGEDLAQQKSSLASARAAIPPLEAEARGEIHALGVLTGEAPETLIGELSKAAVLPSPPEVPPGLPSDLLRRRPDIRSAEQQLHAATADIGVATADLYPSFSLSAAPALVSTALAKLLEWGSRSYSASAALDWPIFNGGRTRGNIAVANARQEQVLIAYRKTVLTALKDVEDALARIEGDRTQRASLAAAEAGASRAEEIARERYRGGLVTYADVLEAQANRIALERQAIDVQANQARDTIALLKALGGGWNDPGQGGTQ